MTFSFNSVHKALACPWKYQNTLKVNSHQYNTTKPNTVYSEQINIYIASNFRFLHVQIFKINVQSPIFS